MLVKFIPAKRDTGGEYRSDWYDVVFQSDDMDEVKDCYMKLVYDSNKPF